MGSNSGGLFNVLPHVASLEKLFRAQRIWFCWTVQQRKCVGFWPSWPSCLPTRCHRMFGECASCTSQQVGKASPEMSVISDAHDLWWLWWYSDIVWSSMRRFPSVGIPDTFDFSISFPAGSRICAKSLAHSQKLGMLGAVLRCLYLRVSFGSCRQCCENTSNGCRHQHDMDMTRLHAVTTLP